MTYKQKRFVNEYLVDLNATRAAIRAGYGEKNAGSTGCELLKNPKVLACIEKAEAERAKRTGITADRVLHELGKICFYNAPDFIDVNSATLLEDAKSEDTAVIVGVRYKKNTSEYGDGVEREIRLADKVKALELCGKHLGLWANGEDKTLPITLNINYDYGNGSGDSGNAERKDT